MKSTHYPELIHNVALGRFLKNSQKSRRRAERISARHLRPRQQVHEIVVDAGGAEVRFAAERLADVVHAMFLVANAFHDGEDEVFWLIQGIQNLVARHREGRRRSVTALHLDEAQTPRGGYAAFDIVAQTLDLPIDRDGSHRAGDQCDEHIFRVAALWNRVRPA